MRLGEIGKLIQQLCDAGIRCPAPVAPRPTQESKNNAGPAVRSCRTLLSSWKIAASQALVGVHQFFGDFVAARADYVGVEKPRHRRRFN